MKALKERIASTLPGFSGATSLLGGYNICHNVCLALLAGLALIGISVKGMPLAFLQELSIPLWVLGTILLLISLFLYIRKKCISRHLLAANAGILMIAVPFRELEGFHIFFIVFGLGIIIVALYNYLSNRRKEK